MSKKRPKAEDLIDASIPASTPAHIRDWLLAMALAPSETVQGTAPSKPPACCSSPKPQHFHCEIPMSLAKQFLVAVDVVLAAAAKVRRLRDRLTQAARRQKQAHRKQGRSATKGGSDAR
jgi:hypothetical protein